MGRKNQVIHPGPVRQAKFRLIFLVIAGHRIVCGVFPGQELFRGHRQVVDVHLLFGHPEELLEFRVRDLGKGGHFLNDLPQEELLAFLGFETLGAQVVPGQ